MDRPLSLVVFALMLAVDSGSAIRCYQCSSLMDSKCGDPVDTSALASYATNCDQDFTKQVFNAVKTFSNKLGLGNPPENSIDKEMACYKLKTHVGDVPVVMRLCSPGGELPCSDINDGFCGQCTTDLCNGGNHLNSFSIIIYSVVTCLVVIIGF